MSIDVMREVWKHADFKGGALLVLLAMADWADDEGGNIFPKVETLARKARLSVRGAQLALRELEDARVIEKVIEATGRPGRASEYKIVLARVKKLQASENTERGAIPNGDGCSLQHEGVQSETGGVQSATAHIDNHHSIHHENPSSDPPAASPPSGGSAQGDLLGQETKPPSPAQVLDAAYAAFDEAADRAGWPKIGMRTTARDKHLQGQAQGSWRLCRLAAGAHQGRGQRFLLREGPTDTAAHQGLHGRFRFSRSAIQLREAHGGKV